MPRKDIAEKVQGNIDAELTKLFKKIPGGNLEEAKKLDNTRKYILYYVLKKCSDETRASTYFRDYPLIKSGNHPIEVFMQSRNENEKDEIITQLLTNHQRADITVNIVDAEEDKNKVKNREYLLQKEIYGLFAPKTDGTKIRQYFGANSVREPKYDEVQKEIDAIELPVPKGLDENMVGYVTMGISLLPEFLAEQYKIQITLPGSSLPEGIDLVDGGRGAYFESFLPDNSRMNMHSIRLLVPAIRNESKRRLEEFENGNKQPVANALYNVFKEGLGFALFTADKKKTEFIAAARMAGNALRMLQSDELKGLVKIDEKDIERARVLEAQIKIIDEYYKTLSYLEEYVAEKVFTKEESNPLEDPVAQGRLEKLLALKLYIAEVENLVQDLGRSSKGKTNAMLSDRKLFDEERYIADYPEIYFEYLKKAGKHSDMQAKFKVADNWEKFLAQVQDVSNMHIRVPKLDEKKKYEELSDEEKDMYDEKLSFKYELSYAKIDAQIEKLADKNAHKQYIYRSAKGEIIDKVDANELLQNGQKVYLDTYAYGDFIGKSVSLKLNKKDYTLEQGKEKIISKVEDLRTESKHPKSQLESLKHVYEVLKKSDPFYVKNSTEFNDLMKSMAKLVKVQENIKLDANLKQIVTMADLYEEVYTNADKYVKAKEESLKTTDSRGNLRVDTIKSLMSITKKGYVVEMANTWYDEERCLITQARKVSPSNKIFNKWAKVDKENLTPEKAVEYLSDFKEVIKNAKQVHDSYQDMRYAKLAISYGLGKTIEYVESICNASDNIEKIPKEDMDFIKAFNKECEAEARNYAQLDGEVKEETKEKNSINKEMTK